MNLRGFNIRIRPWLAMIAAYFNNAAPSAANLFAICLLATSLSATSPAAAQAVRPEEGKPVKAGSLTVEAAWSRATPGGAKVAGGYLKITNHGKEADRLVGGTFARAGRFEIHEMAMTDGIMRMRHLPDGLEIKPGETVEFKPGGYHIMFMDLREGLKQGQTVKGTLRFEKAGSVEVEYRVGPVGGGGPPAAGGNSHSHR